MQFISKREINGRVFGEEQRDAGRDEHVKVCCRHDGDGSGCRNFLLHALLHITVEQFLWIGIKLGEKATLKLILKLNNKPQEAMSLGIKGKGCGR